MSKTSMYISIMDEVKNVKKKGREQHLSDTSVDITGAERAW